MVLRLKKKKGVSTVQVDYIVSVLEIKPWPPSIPLCSVQTVMIQWENGDQSSGFLPPGVPSLNGFEGGKIEFNEFFKLPVTLCAAKNNAFQKNYLEFNLYEPRKDKAAKGQLLGTATVNLAEYGIIKEGETVGATINMKKTSKGMTPTFLWVKIQPFDNEGIESVLKLMSENCEDESDDDEGTSNSSRTPSVSDSSRNSQFQIDEVLNFVSVGLNSEISSPRSSQPNNTDEHPRKQDQVVQKDVTATSNRSGPVETHIKNLENTDNGNEDRNSTVRPAAAAERDTFSKFSEMATKQKLGASRSSTFKFGRRSLDLHGLKHMKSVKVPSSDTLNISAPISVNHKPLENVIQTLTESVESKVMVVEEPVDVKKEKKGGKVEKKGQLEARVEMLEEELRESAAIEMSLYSAVTEHVNSIRKVHSPARRLSRFYKHSCGLGLPEKRARAARAIVSGLVLVSKASGSDVSRLTFWLSNMIMVRGIVNQIHKELPAAVEIGNEAKGKGKNKTDKKSQQAKEPQAEDEWEEPQTFILAMEKLEAWTFYRMVESLWWQSFTPHMQTKPAKKKGRRAGRKSRAWRFGLGDQEQGTYSIHLWKKAFQDAWERLCPIRPSGHDCGCLPMLSKSVMEQLVYRLDVAMFNAVLRESDQEMMPTDPVSDPITDAKVLPIPCGRSSFGAGAQLKNAVGSWSSWLTDFFGESPDDNQLVDNNKKEVEGSFKLLNALSDLMMLPLGMLSDGSTRKEVCPLLGAPLIQRVLNNFIPDEFSPEPVPESLLIALESENPVGASKEAINSFPCKASPVYYAPVPIALLSNMIGEPNKQKGGSSILRKSYNSDDDLERMNSPLATLIKVDNNQSLSSDPNWVPHEKAGKSVVRYKLLQQVWKNGP